MEEPTVKEESTDVKIETSKPVRRSLRAKMPNSDLIYRQNMLSRIPVPAIKRQKMPKTPKRRKIAKVSKVDIQIKDDDSVNCEQSSQITQSAQHEQTNKVTQSAQHEPTNKVTQSAQHVQIEIKKEKDDGDVASDSMYKPVSFERSNDFTVMKNFGIMCAKGKSIEPVYFPTEVENSGLILFNGSSDSVKLMISYPKCFVILNGEFEIDRQGIFKPGDFIKAPAGSQIGIKYLGDADSCGRIIFYISQS